MADPVTMLLVAGTAMTAGGSIMEGNAAEKSSRFTAQQLERNADTEIASSQREAIEERRRTEIMESRVRAVAAAGGGTSTGAGVTEILAKIDNEGEYNALAALYEGRERASGLRAQAAGARVEGKIAKKAGRIRGIGSVLSMGSKLF